jgi:hypothetical protein
VLFLSTYSRTKGISEAARAIIISVSLPYFSVLLDLNIA